LRVTGANPVPVVVWSAMLVLGIEAVHADLEGLTSHEAGEAVEEIAGAVHCRAVDQDRGDADVG
jgi:hypothetical protein